MAGYGIVVPKKQLLKATATRFASLSQTPYLGLNLPPNGYLNWDVPVNQNFVILDTAVGSLGASGVKLSPTGAQSITQPSGTNFSVNTSGGGIFYYDGYQVLNAATGVMLNPTTAQNIVQPSGTNLSVNTSGGGVFYYDGYQVLNATTGVLLNPTGTQTINQPTGTTLNVTGSLTVMGKPASVPAGSAAFYFDPTGTSGAGTAHIDVSAPTGMGMPSLNFNGVPGDGTPFWTFMRFQTSVAAPGITLGVPEVEMPSQLSLFNEGFNSWNVFIGQYYLTGRKGMTIWARAATNEIDFQGQTIGGAYDQAINLNALGGTVQLGMSVVVDAAGSVTGVGNLTVNGTTNVTGHQIINVAAGVNPTDAVNVSQLAGAVSLSPTTAQNIVQPSGTNLSVNTSGGGIFYYDGYQVLNAATGVILNPTGTQTITQPAGTTLSVAGSLSVNGTTNVTGHQIINVAAGVNPTDAVNVSQLAGTVFLYPPAGIVVSTGTSWGAPIAAATLATWPAAGIPVSVGTAWGASLAPSSLATYPAAGVPVSTGIAWGTSIPSATIVVTNPTVSTLIDPGWNYFQIRGSAPAAIPGNGASAPGATGFVGIQGPAGQSTTGTTGQTAGNGGINTISGGLGGSAPAGSTNGAGGSLYLEGGGAGNGAGTAAAPGFVAINNNWGDTYIGGLDPAGRVHVAHGGVTDFYSNVGATGLTTPAHGGLTICWNLGNGPGETDFINTHATGSGGFFWYSAAPSTALTNTTRASMWLDSSNNLGAWGAITSYGPGSPSVGASMTFMQVVGSYPVVGLINASGAANQKWWQILGGSDGTLHFHLVSDDDTVANDWMTVSRSGTTPTGVQIVPPVQVDATLNVGGNFSAAEGTWSSDGGSTQLTITPQYYYVNLSAGSKIMQVNGNLEVAGAAGTFFQVGTGGDFHVVVGSAVDCWQPLNAHVGLTVTGAKNFQMIHPLDEEKYLLHSCLEGPEVGVFYRGEVLLADGAAEVTLPDYFEPLTFPEERSVLLTQIDDDKELAVLAAGRIVDGKFRIRSSIHNALVAWEVKAVRRHDGTNKLAVVRPRDRASEVRPTGAPAPNIPPKEGAGAS